MPRSRVLAPSLLLWPLFGNHQQPPTPCPLTASHHLLLFPSAIRFFFLQFPLPSSIIVPPAAFFPDLLFCCTLCCCQNVPSSDVSYIYHPIFLLLFLFVLVHPLVIYAAVHFLFYTIFTLTCEVSVTTVSPRIDSFLSLNWKLLERSIHHMFDMDSQQTEKHSGWNQQREEMLAFTLFTA